MSNILPVEIQHLFNTQIPLNRTFQPIQGRICQYALITLATGSLAFLYIDPAASDIRDFYNRNIRPPLEYCGNKVKTICTIFCKAALISIGRTLLFVPIAYIFKDSSTYVPIPGIARRIANLFRKVSFEIYTKTYVYFLRPLGIKWTPLRYAVLFAPIVEELLNRFCFQELFLKRVPKFAARKLDISFDPDRFYLKCSRIALSAILFAATHSLAFSTDPSVNRLGAAALRSLIFTGLMLGTLQEATGNVMYPIAAHMTHNAMLQLARFCIQTQD